MNRTGRPDSIGPGGRFQSDWVAEFAGIRRTMTDWAGRTGIGVSLDSDTRHTRTTLIIDPNTSQLLGEEEVSLQDNELGYKPGTVLGYSTYLLVTLVPTNDALPEASN